MSVSASVSGTATTADTVMVDAVVDAAAAAMTAAAAHHHHRNNHHWHHLGLDSSSSGLGATQMTMTNEWDNAYRGDRGAVMTARTATNPFSGTSLVLGPASSGDGMHNGAGLGGGRGRAGALRASASFAS